MSDKRLPEFDGIATEFLRNFLTIKFTRPEIRNPLSVNVLEGLNFILDETENCADVEEIIFTGKDDVFASGADLREIAEVTGETAKTFALRGQNLMNKIENSAKQTIAAINGFCFGGALDLALACKQRIVSPYAVFSHPGANLGIMTGWGGTQRLPRLIGEAKALEMFFLAKRVDAEEALKIGLIDKIVQNPLDEILKIGEKNGK
ncbi:MAG: enoyl-CoA hydratase/isomerase family protein [Pyrinomonadaceae bacterium]|nr:enoyl-CoA hydratase/isomerase family protein [Pyrinomonadaceae bacterium]